MANSGDWVRSFYACGLLGAVAVPLSTRFRRQELAFCLEQAEISTLLFIDRLPSVDYRELLLETGMKLPLLERKVMFGGGSCLVGAIPASALLEGGADETVIRKAAAETSPEDPLLIQFTSGTTSFPKGVVLTHLNLLRNADAAAERMRVRADDRFFSVRPFY